VFAKGPWMRGHRLPSPGRRAAAKLLARDEARRIAANIAKLPELVTKAPGPTGIVNPRPPDGAKVRRLP
jgi:hypothetical protein